jgi:preprotein translocase subunit SecF
MKKFQFDFIKNSKYTVFFSLVIIAIGIFSLVSRGGLNLGIDFAGGKNIRIKVDQSVPMDSEKLRSLMGELKVNPGITKVGGEGIQEFFIYYQEENDTTGKLKQLMNREVGEGKWEVLSEDFVGPKIGSQFQRIAVQATILILVILMIYIGFRFEIRFGVAAILALIHDVMITLTFISLLDFKFDIPLLAAVLTIIGYSLNDTIVIFDRIREETKALHLDKHEYVLVINGSIMKSMTRTILTSLTTLMVLGVLIAFGGIELQPMAITLFIGVIAGTYSSNFIASPALIVWEKLFGKRQPAQKKKNA